MIFSSRRFLQKTNERILLYYYETSGRLVFLRFLEEIEDTKKTFRNYLTFTNMNWKKKSKSMFKAVALIFLSYNYFLFYFYSTTEKAFGQRMRKCQHSARKLLGFPLFFKGVRSGVQRLWSLVLSLHRGHWGRFGHIHGGWPLKTASTVQYGVEKTYTSYTTGYEWIFMIQEILFFQQDLKRATFFFILSKMKVYSYTVYFSYRSSI